MRFHMVGIMKRLLPLLLFFGSLAFAATAEPTPEPVEPAPFDPVSGNLQVELLAVTVPNADALDLQPLLRDPKQIDRGYSTVLDLIRKKRAQQVAWPILYTRSGNRAVAEAIHEHRYPTAFERPPGLDDPKPKPGDAPDAPLPDPAPIKEEKAKEPAKATVAAKPEPAAALPTEFETRNLGVSLEIEPVASDAGETIEAAIAVNHVHLRGTDTLVTGGTRPVSFGIAQFATNKVVTNVVLRNGQRMLLGSFPALDRPECMEFFILRITVQPLAKLPAEKPAKAPAPR